MHAHVQPHPLPRIRVYLKHGGCAIHAGGLRVRVHDPILRNIVADGEDSRLVGRILYHVFLLGNPDKETGALTLRDLLFDLVGRQHALKVTNSVIAESVNVVA